MLLVIGIKHNVRTTYANDRDFRRFVILRTIEIKIMSA